MIFLKEKNRLHLILAQFKKDGHTIGFVPTMGALHQGHISLVKQSLADNNITVVCIFINPTQFNDKKDFDRYPITLENDIFLLEKAGTHILFLPSVEEMYPEGLQPAATYTPGPLETTLEGFYRPGHFQGVRTIMQKLLSAVKPQHLYMGQKDYQQCMVIQNLITGLGLSAVLHIAPTTREKNGLAMSSRNARLSPAAKNNAKAIYEAHLYIKNNLLKLPPAILLKNAKTMLLAAGFEKIDYVEICGAADLLPVSSFYGHTKLVVVTAAFIEGVRLIDNMLLN